MASENPALLAGLIALAVGLVKIIEVLVSWIKDRVSETEPEKNNLSNLDDLKEDLEKNKVILEEHLDQDRVIMAICRDIANSLKDVSHSQERLLNRFDKFSDDMEEQMTTVIREIRKNA